MEHAYRVVLNKLSSGSSFVETLPPEVVSDIVRALFPRLPAGDYQPTPSMWRDELIVTGSKMVKVCSRITPERAPGSDGITDKMVRDISYMLAALWARFTVLLEEGHFPSD